MEGLSANISSSPSPLPSSSDSEADSGPLKLYLLPYPSPGHMNPLLNLAQVLAFRGHHVTILTTPANLQFLPKDLNFHTFNFPSDQVGLPPNLQNLSSAQDSQTAQKIWRAIHLLKSQIQTFLQQNPPHVLISDNMFPWNFASTLNIPTLVFNPMPIFNLCVAEAINNHPHVLPSDSSPPFVVPGALPHIVTLNFNPWSTSFVTMVRSWLHAKENNTLGVIVNTFAELEDGYTQYYQKLTGVKVWHVGLLSLMVDYYQRRSTSSQKKNQVGYHECIDWLNSKEPNSVIYICFGSLCHLPKEQYLEIVHGMEASEYNFLLVLPKNVNDDDTKEEKLLYEFEVRMRENDKGMVVRGWVPQDLILKHVAIGGFLTHCGSNSTMEAICEGVPLITMPRFADQFLCEKLATQVFGVGEEVGVWEWSMSPYDVSKEVVSWERIKNAVIKVMKDEGGFIKKRVKELQRKAHEAIQEGGSSYDNVTTLIQSIKQINV